MSAIPPSDATMSGCDSIPPVQQDKQVLQEMQQRIMDLELLYSQPTAPQSPVHQATTAWSKEPKISSPPPFSGRKDEALEFLLKCDMVFDVQPRTSSSTKAKIAFVTNLLKDEAYRCHILSFRRPTSQPGSMAIPISLRLHNKSSRSSNNRRRQPVTPLSSPALPPIFIGMMRRSVTLTSMV